MVYAVRGQIKFLRMEKCINESCGSSDVVIISKSESNVLNRVGNVIGAAVYCVGCLTIYHGPALRGAKDCWNEAQRSVKVTYKCNKCGYTWTETDWGW